MMARMTGMAGWVLAVSATVWLAGPAAAETKTVRIAKQFGISYLPITVMEKNAQPRCRRIVAKHLKLSVACRGCGTADNHPRRWAR